MTGHSPFCSFLNLLANIFPSLGASFEVSGEGEKHCARCGRYIHLTGEDENGLIYEAGRAGAPRRP